MDYSPYHIYFRVSRRFRPEDVERVIRSVEPENVEAHVRSVARRSRFFSSVFLYEARKFGVISRDADISRVRLEKIIEAYLDTPLYTDSVRKLVHDYMDMPASWLHTGPQVRPDQGQACQWAAGSSDVFLSHYMERVAPLKPTRAILETVKNRLLNEEMRLVCTVCGNVRTVKVRDVKSVRCPSCGSSLVAALSPFEAENGYRDFSKLSERERRRLVKNAHIVRERGGTDALIVLAARGGIGPETASRLLEVTYASEEDLLRAILNAEVDYARNRRFWD